MDDFTWLETQVRLQFPDAQIHTDLPEMPQGDSWLDLVKDGKKETVQWKPGVGFGFFADDATFGEGPNQIILEKEKALEKLVLLFS